MTRFPISLHSLMSETNPMMLEENNARSSAVDIGGRSGNPTKKLTQKPPVCESTLMVLQGMVEMGCELRPATLKAVVLRKPRGGVLRLLVLSKTVPGRMLYMLIAETKPRGGVLRLLALPKVPRGGVPHLLVTETRSRSASAPRRLCASQRG